MQSIPSDENDHVMPEKCSRDPHSHVGDMGGWWDLKRLWQSLSQPSGISASEKDTPSMSGRLMGSCFHMGISSDPGGRVSHYN